MDDTDMTSDFLIYNILKTCDDDFIRKCNVKFIDESVPAQEDNTIYIANIDLETHNETFNNSHYRALVNVYVKTKNTDYIEGSRFLRTVIKHIKHVLRENEDCKSRKITFRNMTYEYGSKYTLKGMHLIIQLLEVESKSLDDEFSCIHVKEDDLNIREV